MIQWEPRFELGIPRVDTQHRALVALINRLEALQMDEQVNPRDIAESFKHLVEYIRIHFTEEEELLFKFRYDEFESHQVQHRKFVQFVENFQKRFDQGEKELIEPILHFLTDWLLNHIARSDRAYVEFFERTGVIEAARAVG